MRESRLYKPVADFIRTKFDCFEVFETRGTIYGKIDVVGLRYSMGRRGGSAEVIAVEIKRGIPGLLKALGQAVGYSVMADRCYLAVYDYRGKIGQLERELAAQLNLGLISIGPAMKPEVLVSSPQHTPLRSHRLQLLRSLGFIECVLCKSFWPATNMTLQGERGSIRKALQVGKGFRYSLPALTKQRRADSPDWRYLCGDCVVAFAGLASQSK